MTRTGSKRFCSLVFSIQVSVIIDVLSLPSSKHNEKVDFIAVLDGFNEFIGVGSRMIYKNLNDV